LGLSMSRDPGHRSADTIQQLRRARTLAGTEERVLRNLAVVATHAGFENTSGDLLHRTLICAPGDARSWRILAQRRRSSRVTQLAGVLLNPTDLNLLRTCVLLQSSKENWSDVLSALRFASSVDLSEAFELAEIQSQALVALSCLDDALRAAEGLIQRLPLNAKAWQRLGTLLRSADRSMDARQALRRSVVIDPALLTPYAVLGRVELSVPEPEAALKVIRRARTLAGGGLQPGLDHNYAATLALLRRGTEARSVLRRILLATPDDPGATLNLATAEQYTLDFDAAVLWVERTLMISPKSVDVLFNAGLIARYAGVSELSRRRFKAALALDPDHMQSRFNLANLDLQDGDRAEGVKGFLDRFRVEGFSAARQLFPEPSLAKPVWDLSPAPEARVFIWGEQGIGDEIWFTQYLDKIRGRVGSVVLEISSKLVPLVRRSFPWIEVMSRGDPETDAAAARADMQLPIGNLLKLCEEHHPTSGFLTVNQDLVAAFRRRYQKRFGTKRLIGISWRSVKPAAKNRSFVAPLQSWAPIFNLPQTEIVSLQYNPEDADIKAATDALGVKPFIDSKVDSLDDISALAAQIAALDAVVSIANSTVMLAHGVGKRAYVPLRQLQDDFRYPRDSDRSFWLPDVRFAWAPPPDRWEAALGDLASQIAADWALEA
ncbi:MAG: tetratricopeptide repeat protein, partial [Thalassobaculaceae bacterium]|nr:tetratricopeptide repeat protein [Thalassobaculaceae bacterium]